LDKNGKCNWGCTEGTAIKGRCVTMSSYLHTPHTPVGCLEGECTDGCIKNENRECDKNCVITEHYEILESVCSLIVCEKRVTNNTRFYRCGCECLLLRNETDL
jgi:hypothetical protein